jgi:hypothetical protein
MEATELKLVVADHRVDITLWHVVFRFEEQANKALHLTASSLRSFLASASGSS